MSKITKRYSTRNCFITIDFEDWETIPYLKKYNFDESCNFSFCEDPRFFTFFDELKEKGISATIFVVASIAEANTKVLRHACEDGHSIGCHSFGHDNLKNMSLENFCASTANAKRVIEQTIQGTIFCYRAPFFSADKEKLLALPSLGFSCDSSYIDSSSNPYYVHNDFSGWITGGNGFLVSEESTLQEAEIPTVKFFGKKIPIGGGGFFRLYPFFFYKALVSKYLKTHQNFVFFIHPYEINYRKFPGVHQMSFADRVRFDLGRKKALKKFWKLVGFLKKKGFTFNNFDHYFLPITGGHK